MVRIDGKHVLQKEVLQIQYSCLAIDCVIVCAAVRLYLFLRQASQEQVVGAGALAADLPEIVAYIKQPNCNEG